MLPLLASLGLLFLIGWFLVPRLLRVVIKSRLNNYIRVETEPEEELSRELSEKKSVAILGAGVAGLTAATTLARRGYDVRLLEQNDYLGGKLGSWKAKLESGREVWISHGFHAFFPHYHNLNRFLDSFGLREDFVSIGDYVIIGRDGETVTFADLDNTPVFNLISLLRAGVFGWGDATRAPGRDLYSIFLEYDRETTFRDLDGLSYADFSERAQVPPRLKLAFNTFARAFFSSEDKLSLAELVKSFHFFYLSHDGGLVYDYPELDYEAGLLAPIRKELTERGAQIELNRTIRSLECRGESFAVDGEEFDRVVLATDVVGAAEIFQNATGLPEELTTKVSKLRPGQRYSVYRLWLDKDIREEIPVFVITEKVEVLDSVTAYHRFEKETQEEMATRTDGVKSVLELHCYSVPDELPDEKVKERFLSELTAFFPELKGVKVLDSHFQLNRNFTAFHVGLDNDRPTVETGVPGLALAGDWVKLSFPAMLLECACASGVAAANQILREDGLQQEKILSVPLQGLLHGVPPSPGRKRLFEDPKSAKK